MPTTAMNKTWNETHRNSKRYCEFFSSPVLMAPKRD
jgi:hypothetical protein